MVTIKGTRGAAVAWYKTTDHRLVWRHVAWLTKHGFDVEVTYA